MDLTGKTALVTGSARRVGRAIALALADAGADLALHYHRSGAEAEGLAVDIRRLGRRAQSFPADLADPAAIEGLFAAVAKAMPPLLVLVNNASTYPRTPLETLTAAQWDSVLAVNARAPALCIRHAAAMMPGGGSIVNITDSGAQAGWAGYPAYCASKAALESLTRSAARALAGRNIRVNAVGPGVVAWEEATDEAVKDKVLAHVPMKRPGSPEDIAAAVVFLAKSEYVTAQILRVDGGWRMS
ncbi:MAG: SDR family oxidoreductase [Planctomycetota bacterium]|nr:SDR family oxidoreductase [Planctomycetota bacterium]